MATVFLLKFFLTCSAFISSSIPCKLTRHQLVNTNTSLLGRLKYRCLYLIKYLAYRGFLGIDISVPNIYRFYGNEFEGIGTLLEDEIDDLDEQPEKLRCIKVDTQKVLEFQKMRR